MSSPVAVRLPLSIDALLHPDPDGGYTAEVPALPGCYSEGDSLEEAVANIREAAEGWLAAAHSRMRSFAARPAAGDP